MACAINTLVDRADVQVTNNGANMNELILSQMSYMLNLAKVKNEVSSQLNRLTKQYRKFYKIQISDYTKYPLSYFYFTCLQNSTENNENDSSNGKNDKLFFELLPNFFKQNTDLALSFISNSIYSDITFSIPAKVKVFSKAQIRQIFQHAVNEIINHKDLCAIYIRQFSLQYRQFGNIKDVIVKNFLIDIVDSYKSEWLVEFKDSRDMTLSLFSISYPYLTAEEINSMLPIIFSGTSQLKEFFTILDTLSLTGLNNTFIDKVRSKYVIRELADRT